MGRSSITGDSEGLTIYDISIKSLIDNVRTRALLRDSRRRKRQECSDHGKSCQPWG